MFDLTPLLILSPDVPPQARVALEAARRAAPEARPGFLEAAALALVQKTELTCGEARELVGLSLGACG